MRKKGDPNKAKKILLLTALILLTLAALLILGAVLYWNSLLNLMGDAGETIAAVPSTAPAPTVPQPTETTSPEDTWPTVVSDENITNIMLIGQNYREGETHKLADTMILCSLNRETKTLTLVSILRDLYVPIPAYAGHGADKNRINVCYHYGSKWTGKPEGGMELLAKCVEQNFGIPIDHSIEINFDAFIHIIDAMGGVEIELTKAEADYLTAKVGYVGEFQPGLQTLNGTEALAYARIRKIDGDIRRTGRQRTVITSLLDKCRGLGLMELHSLAVTVLPFLTTDMTNQEITGYVWEFLPMLKGMQIRSITCPVDNETLPGSWWNETVTIGGTPCAVIQCSLRRNREYLADFLGLAPSQ